MRALNWSANAKWTTLAPRVSLPSTRRKRNFKSRACNSSYPKQTSTKAFRKYFATPKIPVRSISCPIWRAPRNPNWTVTVIAKLRIWSAPIRPSFSRNSSCSSSYSNPSNRMRHFTVRFRAIRHSYRRFWACSIRRYCSRVRWSRSTCTLYWIRCTHR